MSEFAEIVPPKDLPNGPLHNPVGERRTRKVLAIDVSQENGTLKLIRHVDVLDEVGHVVERRIEGIEPSGALRKLLEKEWAEAEK